MIKLSILATATLWLLASHPLPMPAGRPDLVKTDLLRGKQYAAGQLIVQYRSFATDKDKAARARALGGSRADVLGRKGRLNLSGDLELVQFAAGTTMQSKLDAAEERSCS